MCSRQAILIFMAPIGNNNLVQAVVPFAPRWREPTRSSRIGKAALGTHVARAAPCP